jgi:hypothetical protein
MSRLMVVCFMATACGGSVSTNGDGGMDAAPDTKPLPEAGPPDVAPDVPVKQPYDGTTGKACTTDADCASANGPNVARCSNSVFSPEDYYPTAVCIVPTCATLSDSSGLHFCDGPDDPSSPGICVPSGLTSTGICIPKCTYDQKGSAASGCVGHDTCNAYTGTKENGIGYCWAGCTKDGDCQDNQKCQIDEGLCVVGLTPPTKSIGAACTKSDTNALVCNCLYGTANTGYCSSFCIVGSSSSCTGGTVCDSLEARTYGYTTPNTGMAGYCAYPCTPDGGSCHTNSVCTNVFATGPDCIPP